jgi:hypothetical protein
MQAPIINGEVQPIKQLCPETKLSSESARQRGLIRVSRNVSGVIAVVAAAKIHKISERFAMALSDKGERITLSFGLAMKPSSCPEIRLLGSSGVPSVRTLKKSLSSLTPI